MGREAGSSKEERVALPFPSVSLADSLWESMAVAKPGTFTLRDIDQKVVLKVHNSLVASPETNNAFAGGHHSLSIVAQPPFSSSSSLANPFGSIREAASF